VLPRQLAGTRLVAGTLEPSSETARFRSGSGERFCVAPVQKLPGYDNDVKAKDIGMMLAAPGFLRH
jgi:hypothetical protein